jgi:hypothetical protein
MKLTVYSRNWLWQLGEYRPAGMKLSIPDLCPACFYYPLSTIYCSRLRLSDFAPSSQIALMPFFQLTFA